MNLWRVKKQIMSCKWGNIFFKSVLVALFTMIYFYYHRVIFSSCSNMFCEMFYLLRCFASAKLKCFCAFPTLMCLLSIQCVYFIIQWISTNGNSIWSHKWIYLQKDNWAHLLKHWRAINLSYKVLHVQW